MYKTKLQLNSLLDSKVYEAEGETVYDAFDKIVSPLTYPFSNTLRGYGVLSVSDGKRKSEVRLVLLPLKRFINNKASRDIWAERLLSEMK